MKNSVSLFILSIGLLASCSTKTEEAKQHATINQLESPAQAESGEPFLFTYQDSIVYFSWIEKREKNRHSSLPVLSGTNGQHR